MKRNFVKILFAMLLCMSLVLCMISCGDNEDREVETGTQDTIDQTTDTVQEDQSTEATTEVTEKVTADFSKNY